MSNEQFLSKRKRYQPIALPQEFSDEEMVKDWTLSAADKAEIGQHRPNYQLFIAIQLCAVRLDGRFLNDVHHLSPRLVNYLAQQLDLPPTLTIEVPERKATYSQYRQNILTDLGFQKFDSAAQTHLESWLAGEAKQGLLPDELFQQAEQYLLVSRTLLPGPSVLERLIIRVCAEVHNQILTAIYHRLSPDLRQTLDHLLAVSEGEQRSFFHQLKAYPPAAKISSLDMLRQALHFFIREETLKVANAQIVNRHHHLPFSAVHGTGSFSSSDAQRFRIRASSLLAAYYPRYYGYYDKAIGIYTHVSDQYSVFSTKVISCSPREALYVLDGLLGNNTILQVQKHTTDTHGYTEIVRRKIAYGNCRRCGQWR